MKPLLTKREKQIARLILMEYSNEKIAKTIFISTATVKVHRRNIYAKTDAHSPLALYKYIQNHPDKIEEQAEK